MGCTDGQLTSALRQGASYLVHGLDASLDHVDAARRYIREQSQYGPVWVEQLTGPDLPYIDNSVNLLVVQEPGEIARQEMLRVLVPNGVAYIRTGPQWEKVVKPWPAGRDQWTHYLYDSTNNAVAHDTFIEPVSRYQWIGGPRYSRHHDHMSAVSAVVTAAGRIFYIIDESPRALILTPPEWVLVARDAFNGTVLWKRPITRWHQHLWPLKSGPQQLARRLVAVGDRVYVTLAIDGPLVALDAAKWHRTYWLYGWAWASGAGGYYQAGRRVPAGRLLVFNDDTVFGFGRHWQYYRWTTPLEFELFAARKRTPPVQAGNEQKPVRKKGKKTGSRTIQVTRFVSKWAKVTPIQVNSLLLAGDVLFAAGPPDVEDEIASARTLSRPETQQQLARQQAAFEGRLGGRLLAVSARDGQPLAAYRLEEMVRFDGLIAAGGQLYMTTVDGSVVCAGAQGRSPLKAEPDITAATLTTSVVPPDARPAAPAKKQNRAKKNTKGT